MRNIGFGYVRSGTRPGSADSFDIDSLEWSGGEQCLEAWKRRIPEVRPKQGARRDTALRITQYGGDPTNQRDILPWDLHFTTDPSLALQALAGNA